MDNELKKFDYLKETPLRRFVFSTILITVVILLIFLIYQTCTVEFDLEAKFLSLMFIGLIIMTLVALKTVNTQYLITFYENSINLNGKLINNSDIDFIGMVFHSAGRGSHNDFEVHIKDKVFTVRLSEQCKLYFRDYCNVKNIKNNL